MVVCSVVIPTHNRRERLRRTLATIQAQTYAPLEIVVCDDRSADGTSDMIRGLADERIVLVRSEGSGGVANARNAGIAASSGRWVSFCDDDDFWHPDKLTNQIEAMSAADARWAVSGSVAITDSYEYVSTSFCPTGSRFMEAIPFSNPVPGGCSNMVVEKAVLDEVGGFDPALSMLADWDMWLRISSVGRDPALTGTLDILYVHHSGQMSMNLDDTARELAYVRHKHRDRREEVKAPPYEPIDSWVVSRLVRSRNLPQAFAYATKASGRLRPFRAGLSEVAQLTWPGGHAFLKKSRPKRQAHERRWRPVAEQRMAEVRTILDRVGATSSSGKQSD